MTAAIEVNLDGIVGPTHNYAGLSYGNVASEKYAKSVSNPREAALQGLRKMKFVSDLGLPQLVMPPQPRPFWPTLRALGYTSLEGIAPLLLHQAYSASAMWTANAATVSPSADTRDGKVHFTPANLVSNFHRSLEPITTAHYLRQIFPGERFVHHAPLPAQIAYADEGAANHMRLCRTHGERGAEVFVYGGASRKYPARQTKESVEAIARLHGLEKAQTFILEQNAEAIDAGVFHNDVIAMSNGPLFIYHEKAYSQQDALNALKGHGYTLLVIREADLTLAEAVATYFFNSQLLTLPDGGMEVVAPSECGEHARARTCFDRLIHDGHVRAVHYLDVRESMKNGGGPACLRLRVVLTEQERRAVLPSAWLSENLYASLCGWIEGHYRDRISPDDLRDPALAEESAKAMASLSELLHIATEAA